MIGQCEPGNRLTHIGTGRITIIGRPDMALPHFGTDREPAAAEILASLPPSPRDREEFDPASCLSPIKENKTWCPDAPRSPVAAALVAAPSCRTPNDDQKAPERPNRAGRRLPGKIRRCQNGRGGRTSTNINVQSSCVSCPPEWSSRALCIPFLASGSGRRV